MSWFTDKPAFVVLLPYMAGLILAYFMACPLVMSFSLFLIVLFVFIVLRVKIYLTQWLLLVLIFLCGILQLKLKLDQQSTCTLKQFADLPCLVTLEGLITKPLEPSGKAYSATMRVDSVWVLDQGFPTTGTSLLKIYEKCDKAEYGNRIVARGQLRLPSSERNPGDFDYQKYLAAQDISAIFQVISADNVVLLNEGEGRAVLERFVYPVRNYIIRIIDESLSGQAAALLKALLIGLRGDVDTDVRNAFINVGVIHVLAVSGLHVGFVLVGLIGLFSFFRIPNPWRIIVVILCLVFYAFLTGLRPSVVRATIMAVVYLVGLLLQRRAHLLNTLSIAAIIILVISPLDLFEPGFQLSFVAVLGIIFIYHRLSRMCARITHSLREQGRVFGVYMINLLLITVAAQVATIPITIYYFNRFSLISFLANLVVIPIIAGIVMLGMVAVLFSVIHTGIGVIYLNAVWLFLQGIIAFVGAAQHVPFAYFVVPRPSFLLIALYFCSVLSFVYWPSFKVRKAFLFLILIFINIHIWTPRHHEQTLKVTFFDVGQGDAALFEMPNGKNMLVDAGDCTEYVNYGERVIYPYLVRNGIRKINHMLITHAHSDHNGGAPYLLENMSVGRLIKSHLQQDSQTDSLIEKNAAEQHIPIKYVQAGDTLLIDPGVLVLVMHPAPSFIRTAERNSSDLNNSSVVFKCVYFDHSILMAGDAEHPAEKSMLKYGELLRAQILKCGHHGSASSSQTLFRQMVSPDFGIVSVAKFNRFGLPSEQLLNAFENEGTHILKTSACGAVQFLISPGKMRRIG